ncbi:Nose resistant to fluoxetine protein 6 [Holothuria leucospilota]|uniref:Nose resistant to fluoxetine protein 6 n=1 Tax=Holothuria leucospilota TaxID=206669 RepID=A0A9Q1HDD0_HOLLE|nr:Nose resistant to fluoxetine protein 6 [Holothuria leucospilota]
MVLQQKVFTTSLLLLFICAMTVQGSDIYSLYRTLYEAQRGPLLKPNAENVTAECQTEFQTLLYNGTAALVNALDSFGKPQSGLLVGNWAWYGHFTECSNLEDFKYCLLTMIVDAAVIPSLKHLPAIPIEWGVCAPNLCSNEDVHNSVETLLEYLHLTYNGLRLVNVSAAVSCVQKPVVPYSAGFYCCISVCAIVGVLMIVGSVIDVIKRRSASVEPILSVQSGDITPLIPNQENGGAGGKDFDSSHTPDSGWRRIIRKILSCLRLLLLDFALNRNLKKLMTVSETNDRSIDCLNGIRVLSMFWVILGHMFAFGIGTIGLVNYADVYGWTQKFMFQTILNAYFSVDSFFFLSGLLVCYLTLLKLEKKNGRIPWHWFYIHRYIRLTPVMLVTIMIWMYISPYTLWGPKAEQLSERPLCPKYWWANVLYIQNFYPARFGQACISWTWYLANDMQFFIISPIIIYALYRLPWAGYCMVGGLMCGSLAVTGVLTAHFDFPASTSAIAVGLPAGSGDYGNIIYQKPYVRIPPYLVGMFIGHILYRLKDKNFTIPRFHYMDVTYCPLEGSLA